MSISSLKIGIEVALLLLAEAEQSRHHDRNIHTAKGESSLPAP